MTTRQKKSPSTLAKRMGFQDPDLSTPEHDAIMLWLDTNIKQVVHGLYPDIPLEWTKTQLDVAEQDMFSAVAQFRKEIEKMNAYYKEPAEKELSEWSVTAAPVSMRIRSKVWEHPIMSKQYTVAFIDMLVSVETGSLAVTKGQWDSYNQRLPRWRDGGDMSLAFEVKPTIPSVGELIRQIRHQGTYVCPGTKFVVVSPDDRFVDILKNQGIKFIKVPSEVA